MEHIDKILDGMARNSDDIKEMSRAITHAMETVAGSVEGSIGKLVSQIENQNTMLLERASSRIPLPLFMFVVVALVGIFTATLKIVAPHFPVPLSAAAQELLK